MADDPECFGNYNKINSGERAENDCLHCPVLDECARVLNPLKDAFRAGRNVCDAGVKCDASRIQVGESAIAEIDRLRAENDRLKHAVKIMASNPEVMHEDALPEDMPEADYDAWYQLSRLDCGVRVGPIYPPTAPDNRGA